MKDLYTKKLSGQPLAHDAWVARQQQIEDQRAIDADKAANPATIEAPKKS